MRRSVRDELESAAAELAELLSGASIRATAGIRDLGEVLAATIGDDSNDVNLPHPSGNDVWTRFTDTLSGLSKIGRLFVPGGILWRAPAKGDGAHVVRGRKQDGPGGPLVMPDGGDGQTGGLVPPWFPADAGLYDILKNLHIESHGGTVTLTDKAGNSVVLDGLGNFTIGALNLIVQHISAAQAGGVPPVSGDAHLVIDPTSTDESGWFTLQGYSTQPPADKSIGITITYSRPYENGSRVWIDAADDVAALASCPLVNGGGPDNAAVKIYASSTSATGFTVQNRTAVGGAAGTPALGGKWVFRVAGY